MKLSIITPSFQQAQWLPTTIESVINQNYQNLEYIVIDGGSQDTTPEILKTYNDKIHFWVSEKDNGQSDAINKGFKKATGDVVAWINSDDYYYPSIFKKVMSYFEKDPNLIMLYGNCTFVDADDKFLRYFTEVKDYDPLILRNYSDYIMQPTTFFRRDALEKMEYLDESLHYGMDWDLWCKFATNYPDQIKYIPDLIAVNREYEQTKTSSGADVRLKELKIINERHKTTKLHKAALLYSGAEFHNKSNLPKFIKDRLVGALSLSLGASSKLKQKRLFGLIPHSQYLEKEAHIYQPDIHNKFKEISFKLKNPAKTTQTIKLEINDNTIDRFAIKPNGTENFSLPVNAIDNVIKISFYSELEFSKNKVALKLLDFNLN